MTDPTTSNRSLNVPSTGSDVGTWGASLNNNFGALDTIVGGVASVSTTGGTTTLNATQLACGTISLTGTLTADVLIVFPAVQGWWSIANFTVGSNASFSVFVACGSQAALIGIPFGEIIDIQINTNTPLYRNLGRVGSYLDYAITGVPRWISASTVPPYLNCDGTTFSAVTYPALANFLGGTTLPDSRGMSRYTLNQGTSRVTLGVSGLDGNTLFAIKTTQTNTLLTANLPPYSPTGTVTNGLITAPSALISSVVNGGTGAIGTSVSAAGSGSLTTALGLSQAASTFAGVAQGGTSTPFGSVATGVVSGITLIRAA